MFDSYVHTYALYCTKRYFDMQRGRLVPVAGVVAVGEELGVVVDPETSGFSIAMEVEHQMRCVIEEACNFAFFAKRIHNGGVCIVPSDVKSALRLRGYPPLFGFNSDRAAREADRSDLPDETYVEATRKDQSGKKHVFYVKDKIVDLRKIASRTTFDVPVPTMPAIQSHWIAINGVQPSIPENPPPPKMWQSIDDFNNRDNAIVALPPVEFSFGPKAEAPKSIAKPVLSHDLSKELQMYYSKITTSVLSVAPEQRSLAAAAFNSLARDPGIQPLVPYFSKFVAATVSGSIEKLAILSAAMKTTRCLLQNPHIELEYHLHQLMPAVLTCIVGKALCVSPAEDHWHLRDLSSDILAEACLRYGTKYPEFTPKVVTYLADAMHGQLDSVAEGESSKPAVPLTTLYGALVALTRLGPHVIETYVMPSLPYFIEMCEKLIRTTEDNGISQTACKLEAEHCRSALGNAYAVYVSSKSSLAWGILLQPKQMVMLMASMPWRKAKVTSRAAKIITSSSLKGIRSTSLWRHRLRAISSKRDRNQQRALRMVKIPNKSLFCSKCHRPSEWFPPRLAHTPKPLK